MNLAEVLHIWRRRWILTTLALIVALAGSGAAVLKLPRTYQATCTVVLVPSPRAAKALGQGNPYLSFTDSLSTAAQVMATELMAPATEQDLAARGFSEPYTAVSESTTSQTVASGSVLPGPFVLVTVTGSKQQAVEHTLHGVADEIRTTITAMQAGMSRKNRILISTVSLTPTATLSVSMTARSLVLIVGLLIVFAFSMPLIVDTKITRRRIRRAAAPHRIPAQQATRPLSHQVGGHPL